MFGYPKWRAWTVIVVSLLGIFFCIPNFIPSDVYKEKVPKSMQEWWRPMTLGLDLQGGSHLLLEIQIDELVNERLTSLADGTRSSLRENRIKFSGLGVEMYADNAPITVVSGKGIGSLLVPSIYDK